MWSAATQYHHQTPRLGDLMMQRHQITSHQLSLAVLVQRREPTRPIGEILIQLGFISPKQLKRNLRWQRYLQCASVALAFTLAPFHFAAANDNEELYPGMQQFLHGENNLADSDEGMTLFSFSNNSLTTFWTSKPEPQSQELDFAEGGLKYQADLKADGITLGVSYSF